jgi:hypothetical protein
MQLRYAPARKRHAGGYFLEWYVLQIVSLYHAPLTGRERFQRYHDCAS